MGKVNVYFPDEVEVQMREREAPVSKICQDAMKNWLREVGECRHRTLARSDDGKYRCVKCGESVL